MTDPDATNRASLVLSVLQNLASLPDTNLGALSVTTSSPMSVSSFRTTLANEVSTDLANAKKDLLIEGGVESGAVLVGAEIPPLASVAWLFYDLVCGPCISSAATDIYSALGAQNIVTKTITLGNHNFILPLPTDEQPEDNLFRSVPNVGAMVSPPGQSSLELVGSGQNGMFGLGIIGATDPQGSAQLPVPVGDYAVRVGAQGFVPQTPNVTVPQQGTTLNVTLQPLGSGAPPLTIPLGQGLSGCVDPSGGTVNATTLVAFGGAPLSGYTWTLANLSAFPPGTTVDPLTGVFHGSGGTILTGTYNFSMDVTDGNSTATGTRQKVAI